MKIPPSSSPRGDTRQKAGARVTATGLASGTQASPETRLFTLDSADRSAICARYIRKLNELQGMLVQDSSLIMAHMLKLPESKREGMARELGKRHILQALLQPQGGRPDAWKELAGLDEEFDRLSADKQASRLLWREMEVLVKSATDRSRTEAEYNLLIRRVCEYKTALRSESFQHEGDRSAPRARVSGTTDHVRSPQRESSHALRNHFWR